MRQLAFPVEHEHETREARIEAMFTQAASECGCRGTGRGEELDLLAERFGPEASVFVESDALGEVRAGAVPPGTLLARRTSAWRASSLGGATATDRSR